MSYDYFLCDLPSGTGAQDTTYEFRRYDDASVDANGKYQKWIPADTRKNKRWHTQFVCTLTESGWNRYYDTLSDVEKQEFRQRRAARTGSRNISDEKKIDLRPMSELLSGLQSLYETKTL